MARSFARWDVNSWTANSGWRDLTPMEQWCYFMLASQAKLTICGAIDLKLTVWAGYADGLTVEELTALLESLEAKEYVVIDWATEELVIRSFTRHDGCFANQNTGRGVWRAIDSVASVELREVIVENLPDTAFEPKFQPQAERPLNRRSISGSNSRSLNGSNPRNPPHPIPMPEADSPLSGGSAEGGSFNTSADAFLDAIPAEVM